MKINDLTGAAFDCECGRRHTVDTKCVRIGKGAVSALAEDMTRVCPPGSQVAMLYEKRTTEQARRVERELSREGYRVTRFLPQNFNLEGEEYFSAVVGVGNKELCDFSRLLAYKYNKKSVIAPTSLGGWGACLVRERSGLICPKTAANPLLVTLDYGLQDERKSALPSGFGEAVSRLFSVLDARICKCMSGERYCAKTYGEVKATVFSLVDRLKSLDRRDKGVVIAIGECNAELSLLEQLSGEVYCGGEVAATACSQMLALNEGRSPLSFGEESFLYAKSMTDFYLEGLFFDGKAFLPPPDNNRRAQLLVEYLGVDEYSGCRLFSSPRPLAEIELRKYRLGVYKNEITAELKDVKRLFAEAEKIFYRLYEDDGYAVSGVREEGALCVALAPDLTDRHTCLDYFKDTGVLDEIVRGL